MCKLFRMGTSTKAYHARMAENDTPLRLTRRGRALLGLGARTVMRRVGARMGTGGEDSWQTVGEDWFATLSQLRGAAMKLGQLGSQYADLLPPALAEALSRLQAQAEPVSVEQVRAWLVARWTPAQYAELVELGEEPIGVASIGQVHRARLRDGREVAIKVQYPGVAEAIDRDVRNLGRLLRMARLLPVDNARLDQLLDEIRLRLHEECDYLDEAARMRRFRAGVGGCDVVIPEVDAGLSTGDVLVTEYQPAAPLAEAQTWDAVTRDRLGVTLLRWTVHQLTVLQEVHADPHPGNFGFHPDGRVVVYDFGCTRSLSDDHLLHLRRMTGFGLRQEYAAMHAELGRIGSLSEPGKPMSSRLEALYRELTLICLAAVEQPRFDFTEPTLIEDLRQAARRSLPQWRKFEPIPDLVFVARMLSGTYWLLRGLGSRVALLAELEAFAAVSESSAG